MFITQEIIQNADDARATEVTFYLDCRHMQTLPHNLVKRATYSELNRFQGPALMSFNNAPLFYRDSCKSIQEGIKSCYFPFSRS